MNAKVKEYLFRISQNTKNIVLSTWVKIYF